jgi:pimeloyl-ACP methyl ester carboxylesterase
MHYLWTASKARLLYLGAKKPGIYNWLFLPGGPGLGSESLINLASGITVPGMIWMLDPPGDGSNITTNNAVSFSKWSEALVEAVSTLDHVILVTHSTGGMYALATPALEQLLTGLVLISSAPDSSWQSILAEYMERNPIAGIEKLYRQNTKSPTNQLLKKITIAAAPYSFTPKHLKNGIQLLNSLPYNYESCEWSGKHFDSTYVYKWVPKKIPTMIMAGTDDKIIPYNLFEQNRKFHRKNIVYQYIKTAGHFPWIDKPRKVIDAFSAFVQNFLIID